MPSSVIIVGSGIFGLTAGLELHRRGWRVTILEQGQPPHPDAASTDISKVVRSDYGTDAVYTEMGEASIEGWKRWNRDLAPGLYHEDGFLIMTKEPMRPGGFEHDSYCFQTARGHTLERRDPASLRVLHPQWNAEVYEDGYFNPRGGWAESGRTTAALAYQARSRGIEIVERTVFAKIEDHGVQTQDGRQWRADITLMATGAWTPVLMPHLEEVMWSTGQSVLHFKPSDPGRWRAPEFPVWAADIGRTGWYGFPATADGIVKVANHGVGVRVDPLSPREVPGDAEARFRQFLHETFPALADSPVVGKRLCLYCDTFDGDFWIDHDPTHGGLVVAAGDSGHAFKFAPVLGGIVADVVEQRSSGWANRFRSRSGSHQKKERARASSAENQST